MEVTFLRHGPLLSPYDNYDLLTFEQLCQLAKQEIEPEIDSEKAKELVNDSPFLHGEYQTLFHSPSKRAVATSKIILESNQVQNVQQLVELSEIRFDPAKFTTEEEFTQKGLSIIREKLFFALVRGTNIENIDSCIRRVNSLETKFRQSSAQRCICITHGFFMRLLELHFTKHLNRNSYTVEALMEVTNHSYLQGLVVTI